MPLMIDPEFSDNGRRQAERRLVEQQKARLAHQGTRDGLHLLLLAAQRPFPLVFPLRQDRQMVERLFDRALHSLFILSGVRPHLEVLPARSDPRRVSRKTDQ